MLARIENVPKVPDQEICPVEITGYPGEVLQVTAVQLPEKATVPVKSTFAICPALVVTLNIGGVAALANGANPINKMAKRIVARILGVMVLFDLHLVTETSDGQLHYGAKKLRGRSVSNCTSDGFG